METALNNDEWAGLKAPLLLVLEGYFMYPQLQNPFEQYVLKGVVPVSENGDLIDMMTAFKKLHHHEVDTLVRIIFPNLSTNTIDANIKEAEKVEYEEVLELVTKMDDQQKDQLIRNKEVWHADTDIKLTVKRYRNLHPRYQAMIGKEIFPDKKPTTSLTDIRNDQRPATPSEVISMKQLHVWGKYAALPEDYSEETSNVSNMVKSIEKLKSEMAGHRGAIKRLKSLVQYEKKPDQKEGYIVDLENKKESLKQIWIEYKNLVHKLEENGFNHLGDKIEKKETLL